MPCNGTAMKNDALVVAAYFLLGLVGLGLFTYMYGQVQRGKNGREPENGLVSWWKFNQFACLAPFVYVARGVKARDGKAIAVFLAAFLLVAVLLGALVWRGNAG